MESRESDDNQKHYLCTYTHEGEQWSFQIPAYSIEDAEARLKRIAYGRVEGEIVARLRVPYPPLARLANWIGNRLKF